jgi:aerotaxis receptor
LDAQIPDRRTPSANLDQEVSFSFEELFFSRTDARGVILSGNSVFQRISMYAWDELINKPHNIIRHPDMPRAVFWLLWDTIKKDEPIGAYVKNRAKDGRYYWVFAIVTPVDGGFLSVRLKPSALLSIVEGEYSSVAAAAVDNKLSPQDSASVLLGRLAQLGFDDYPAFMAAALSKEMTERNRQLGRTPDRTIVWFDELVVAAKALLDQAKTIFATYAKTQYVPLNLNVRAAQLGGVGASIGVVSRDYNSLSGEIRDSMDRFMVSAQQVLQAIKSGLFLLCTAKVQQEVAEFFRNETSSGDHSEDQEAQLLEQQQQAYERKAVDGLRAIANQADQFRQDCAEMKRLAASLEVTRVMGKMESSRLDRKDGLEELFDDLETFQAAIVDGLKTIEDMNQKIQYNVLRLLRMMASRR